MYKKWEKTTNKKRIEENSKGNNKMRGTKKGVSPCFLHEDISSILKENDE